MWRDRRAVTSIEYALIGALILLVIVAAVTGMGGTLPGIFVKVASGL